MLLKCVAKGRCCPKPEEEMENDPASHAAMHMYCNPFADAAPISSLMSFSGLDSHEFPPGSGALMYSPPLDIDDSDSDKEKGCDGVAAELDEDARIGPVDVEQLPSGHPPAVVAAHPVGVKGPGAGYPSRRAPSNAKMQQGWNGSMPSHVIVPVRGGLPMAPQNAAVPMTSPHKNHSPGAQRTRENSPGAQKSPTTEFRQLAPRRLDTTPRSEAYQSDVGAQSIEVLGKCIAKAQRMPSEKQPNSEKWAGRWESTKINLRDQ